MIQKVKIQNFKSVQSLELELGRLNVFIGENGCGKTNILEAIALGSAALENKVDNEFLTARGVRMTDYQFMVSAFELNSPEEVSVKFEDLEKRVFHCEIVWDEKKIISLLSNGNVDFVPSEGFDFFEEVTLPSGKKHKNFPKTVSSRQKFIEESRIAPFLIFSPENTCLRNFQEEGQILPLGIRGEGLFKHLATLFKDRPEVFIAIKKQLEIIDWFEDLDLPKDLWPYERRIAIKDRFLHPDLQFFDQRSSNEGFLYLMFYFTLFISESTPGFFAIDNIDNALNPKLCSKLIETLAQLAKEHQKQAIVTTHNPAILDGLDLDDDDQRLFVIYRNADGHTTAKRVQKKERLNGSADSVRLSEAFIRGYLGGIPKNF